MAAKPVEDSFLATVRYGKQEEKRYHVARALKSSSQKSVIVFGMTGHGKSSFLNFILRQKFFNTSQGPFGNMTSVTKKTESETTLVEGQQMMLIDTPGFMDSQNIEDNDKQSADELIEDQTKILKKNILQAYLDAGEKVEAFILIYSLNARWTMEVSEMVKFLERLSFPWDHCIVVLTHGDQAFSDMSEEESFKALKNDQEIPRQLTTLMKNSDDRVLIIESTRSGEDGYYQSMMKRFLSLMDKIHGTYTNRHFVDFAQLVEKSREKAYKVALYDKKSMKALEDRTEKLFKEFKSAGNDLIVAQSKFIKNLEKIVELLDKNPEMKVFTPVVTTTTTTGLVTALAGITLIPATLGGSAAVGGLALATLPVAKKLWDRSEGRAAQKSYDEATVLVEKLYMQYEVIMKVIEEDDVGRGHSTVHNLLFAHLAGVHLHPTKEKGYILCPAAENLAIYHQLRKEAKEKSKPGSNASNSDLMDTSPNYAFPIGFNLLAQCCNVAHAVGKTMEITQVSKKTKEADTRVLRSSCIATLEKEKFTIMKLCNIP
jgi:GTP-binding protein EngB required for normal cell division